jgi:hypothetical protein
MTSVANTVKTQIYSDWDLTGDLEKTDINWVITKQDPGIRFHERNISIEMYVMTSPVRKRVLARHHATHILVCDIWLQPRPWDPSVLDDYDDDIDSMADEICQIVKARQTSFTGLVFAHVINEGINLDEISNQILRRQVLVACKEEK